MNKKLVAMLSALSLCVTVTACSKSEDNTKSQSSTNKTSINIESLDNESVSDPDTYIKLGAETTVEGQGAEVSNNKVTITKAEQGIRFINSMYGELFRIADGEKIKIKYSDGEEQERVCRYIDEYHTEVGNNLYHICQFAEIMERNGSEYTPVEPETVQAEEKEQGQEEKTEGTLELKTRFGNTQNVTLEVQQKK